MKLPLVTIGAINYNSASYVVETLNSIALQTYENIELIVVDDASTDNSLSRIKEWLLQYPKPYKLITHSQNQGVHTGYESVIKNASGDFVSFISTDDILTPEKIERQVAAFLQLDESYGVVYGDVVDINEQNCIIHPSYFCLHLKRNKKFELPQGDVFKKVTQEFLIYVQSILVRTSVLKNFSFQYKALSEDWQFILYLARRCNFFGMNTVVAKYRRHATSTSTENRKKEKYHLWCRSNALMFYEAYNFPENSKEEKKIIANRIEVDLLDYAIQPVSKYRDVMKTWREVTKKLPVITRNKIAVFILWCKAKLLIKKAVFSNYKQSKWILQN